MGISMFRLTFYLRDDLHATSDEAEKNGDWDDIWLGGWHFIVTQDDYLLEGFGREARRQHSRFSVIVFSLEVDRGKSSKGRLR